jgi:hypothetical protein
LDAHAANGAESRGRPDLALPVASGTDAGCLEDDSARFSEATAVGGVLFAVKVAAAVSGAVVTRFDDPDFGFEAAEAEEVEGAGGADFAGAAEEDARDIVPVLLNEVDLDGCGGGGGGGRGRSAATLITGSTSGRFGAGGDCGVAATDLGIAMGITATGGCG